MYLYLLPQAVQMKGSQTQLDDERGHTDILRSCDLQKRILCALLQWLIDDPDLRQVPNGWTIELNARSAWSGLTNETVLTGTCIISEELYKKKSFK
jgi:hypothetical protein